MTSYHAAVIHPDQTVTYCGEVDQDHVDQVRAAAALDDVPRHILESSRRPGAVFVVRDDGDLDHYEPTDAGPFEISDPDPNPLPGLKAGQDSSEDDEDGDEPRGASAGTVWISGAIRLGRGTIGGAMDYPGNPPRCVQHTTESPAGGRYLESIGSYLIRVASEPQLIYCPVTDRVGQFGPLNQSARALRNDGSRRTNREGRVCIQVEVLGRAAHPWTSGWDPKEKPGWQKLEAAIRSWGVPGTWPAGKPAATAAAVKSRSRTVWQSKGGYYGHCHVPGNDHWDPGAIDTTKVPGKAATPSQPAATKYEPFPGASFFHPGRHSPIITAMGRRLVAEECGRYRSGPGPDWTNADRASYAAWQRKLGYSEDDADGIPGKTSWDKLRVPNV